MSLPPQAALPFNTDSTLGALLVGGLVAAAFWGVTCAQTLIYFQHSSSDRLSLKLFVSFLWVLDTFDSCLTSHILYWYFVKNYFNPSAIASPVWSVLIHVAITSLTDVLIRAMYARRVYQLSGHSILLTAVVVAISLLDLICGFMITVKAFKLGSFAELNTISGLMYTNFAAGFSGDLFVAVVLCYYLWRSRTGFRGTDTLVKSLVSYIITTGLLTAVDASLGMIFYIVMPNNFVFIAFYFNLAKMYINSYLALLNAREGLRENSEGGVSVHLSDLSHLPFSVSNEQSSPTLSAPMDKGFGLSNDRLTFATDSANRKSDDEYEHFTVL